MPSTKPEVHNLGDKPTKVKWPILCHSFPLSIFWVIEQAVRLSMPVAKWAYKKHILSAAWPSTKFYNVLIPLIFQVENCTCYILRPALIIWDMDHEYSIQTATQNVGHKFAYAIYNLKTYGSKRKKKKVTAKATY